MRIPRAQQLARGVLVHSTWRGHNREWIFKRRADKMAYLDLLVEKCARHDFALHSYCIMNNHDHNTGQVDTVGGYSSLFKEVHEGYAQRYNRRNDRRGAVGMERPKSVIIADERHLINATFYVDANPVRAGITKHPRDYAWSSYNFYAHGTCGPGSRAITLPGWYVRLGDTPAKRQRAYRRLCDAYLRREGLLPGPGKPAGYYATRLQRSAMGEGCDGTCHTDPPSVSDDKNPGTNDSS